MTRDLPGGGRIVAGVEFDAAGRWVFSHIFPDRPGQLRLLRAQRVPADDVIHMFRVDVPGQVRGLSWFAPILLRLRDLDTALDAQLVRQQVAALLCGFVVAPDGGAAGFDGETDNGATIPSLEPGQMHKLLPGEDVRFSDAARIGPEVIDFLRITQREIAAGLGVPYEALTGDLSDVNYSSIRAGLIELRRRVAMVQRSALVHQFPTPVWRRWLTLEVLSGRLRLPSFETDPAPFMRVQWVPPRQHWVDPSKDVAAELDAIAGGLMSRREAEPVAGRGFSKPSASASSDRKSW